jgi:hypothetical protein
MDWTIILKINKQLKENKTMTKKQKEYNVVLQYEIQKIYTVSAKNEEEAQNLVMSGKGSEKSKEDWDYEYEVIEVKEVE